MQFHIDALYYSFGHANRLSLYLSLSTIEPGIIQPIQE